MKKISSIIEQFDMSINEIEKTKLTKTEKLTRQIEEAKNCLVALRLELRGSRFQTEKKEITFFKYQKPLIQGRLQYFSELKKYYLRKASTSIFKQRKFLNKKLQKIVESNNKYFEFINYYKLDKTDLDHLFFLRGNDQFEFFIDNSFHFDDPEFTTRHDYIVSLIIKNDLLFNFYNHQLDQLNKKKSKVIVKKVKPNVLNGLSWTGTKTDLVELLYSLNAVGAIKNGEAEMKKLGAICKELFNIELGNIYKTYSEIKSREKDPTKFLDAMKLNLLKKMHSEY